MTKSVLELPSDIYRKAEMTEKLQQELKERGSVRPKRGRTGAKNSTTRSSVEGKR